MPDLQSPRRWIRGGCVWPGGACTLFGGQLTRFPLSLQAGRTDAAEGMPSTTAFRLRPGPPAFALRLRPGAACAAVAAPAGTLYLAGGFPSERLACAR